MYYHETDASILIVRVTVKNSGKMIVWSLFSLDLVKFKKIRILIKFWSSFFWLTEANFI